jgi:ATP-dependent Lon protease
MDLDEDDEDETYDSEEEESAESTEADSEEEDSKPGRIGLMISSFGGAPNDPNKPKKYKMKDQPANVQKFVKLVQKGSENDDMGQNIDNDITYFKKLPANKQNMIIEKMERKFSMDTEEVPMKFKLLEKAVPQNVEKLALSKFAALSNLDPSTNEYYKCFHWVEGYSNIPFGVYRDLPVKLDDGPEACANFVSGVRNQMDAAIYGHEEAKLQILQFVSSWIANPSGAGNVLSIHGPMGVGKTTLVKDGVAKALGRPFHFISLGGATDASFLDGHSYTYEGSTWGRIADILMQSKCMNPIIYFDELDKISETPKGEEIMNLLIHITDGSQNDKFQDKYFTGLDLDLSRCLFIFSHNNHERVNPILRDRMYNIKVEGFNLKEKLVIAEQYLLAQALKDVGLHEKVSVSKDIVEHIIEHYTSSEKGVRELKRCLQTVMSKLNLLRFYNNPKLVPFAISDFALPFILKKSHIELLLKRKDSSIDPSIAHLYI